jgi:hypothetical protein
MNVQVAMVDLDYDCMDTIFPVADGSVSCFHGFSGSAICVGILNFNFLKLRVQEEGAGARQRLEEPRGCLVSCGKVPATSRNFYKGFSFHFDFSKPEYFL